MSWERDKYFFSHVPSVLKEYFEKKLILKKKSAEDKKHEKFPRGQRVFLVAHKHLRMVPIIGIKRVFLFINICQTQRVVLKSEPERRGF